MALKIHRQNHSRRPLCLTKYRWICGIVVFILVYKFTLVGRYLSTDAFAIKEMNMSYLAAANGSCQGKFSSSMTDNKRVIDEYPLEDAEFWLKKLGVTDKNVTRSDRYPVLVNAASSNHFTEAILVLENIMSVVQPENPDVLVIFYDLGLTDTQALRMKQFPILEYRRLPYSDLPTHIQRNFGYAWKPVILQMVSLEYHFFIWLDAAIRFTSGNLDDLRKHTKKYGISFRSGSLSLVPHTDLDTFKFLGEDPCLFLGLNHVEAGFIGIYSSDFLQQYVIRPLVSCALLADCMVTKNGQPGTWTCRRTQLFGRCHKYDQSVLSIILYRLFQKRVANLYIPQDAGIKSCRGFTIPYLPEKLSKLFMKFLFLFLYKDFNC